MLRERYFWLMIGLLVAASLACNAFAGEREGGVLPPTPPVTITSNNGETGSTAVTQTPTVEATVTVAATETPSGPTARVLVDLNVRTGPGIQYDRVSFLLKDEQATIIGTDPTASWWKIECPPRTPVADVQCWISGGDNFSQAVNTAGVPVAEVPPTPTPVPPEPEPERAIIGFVENGRLFVSTFSPADENTAVSERQQLLPEETNVQQAFISPDGRRAAYLRGTAERNQLYVVNLDGRGQNLLVDSEGLPRQSNEVGLTAVIDQVQWLPDSSGLAFNTAQYVANFGATASQEDLWTVTLAGDLQQRLPFFVGGGRFLILPNGEIILSKSDAIERVNADGSNRLRLVGFDFINTASEYIYYPILQLAQDGSTIYTAVPSADPFAPDAFTHLWRIRSQSATEIGRLPHMTLFDPVQWSANGNRLAYVAFTGSPLPAIIVADGNGDNALEYALGEQARFLGWSDDEQRFLYTTANRLLIGQPGSEPQVLVLPGGGMVQRAEWVENGRYLITTQFGDGWRIDSGDATGNIQQLLLVTGGNEIAYDVWLP